MATILIDFGSRESQTYEEIADRLQSSGIDSYVDDQDGYHHVEGSNFFIRSKLDKDFILTPSFSSHRTWYVRLRSLLKDIPLILFHSEQIVNPEFINEKLDFIGGNKFLSDVDYHLVWGKEFATLLLGRGVPREKIYIVGSPRLYNGDPNANIRVQDKVVILTSFDPAEWSDHRWLEECKTYQYNPELKLHNKYKEMRIMFCESLLGVISNSLDESFVIRTHPGESISFYKDFFKAHNNVSIENGDDKPLMDTLKGASFVINPMHSTVIYDLIGAGVDFICIDCIDTEATYPKAAYDGINYKDVVSLADLKNKSHISINAARSQFQRFFDNQKLSSTDRVVAALIDISKQKKRKKKWDVYDCIHIIELLCKTSFVRISNFMPKVIKKSMHSKIESSRQQWIDGGHGKYINGHYSANPKKNYVFPSALVTYCPETNCKLVKEGPND